MKIGLIYYSQTGHTGLVAGQLVSALENAGHQVKTVPLSATQASIKEMPSIEPFDALILGTPVHGGRMSAPVRTFLESIASFAGKKVSFFLTHFLPRQWGAVQTIDALEKLCTEKGAVLQGSADVTWFSLCRKKQIREAVNRLSKLV